MSVRLHGMTCGWLTMAAGTFLKGEKGFVAVPVPCYLIEHPKGVVLFDTGLAPDIASPDPLVRERSLGNRAARVRPTYAPGEDVASRLKASGIDPARIGYLVTSHLHFDHVGGNALVPNTRWLIQKREWQWACSDECKAAGNYDARLFDLGHERIEVDGEYDIFGDGSLVCFPSFGHTPGHQSMRVKLDDGEIVLAADSCYMCRSLDNMHLPGNLFDEQQSLQTFHRLAAYRQAGAQVVFGHDPEQWIRLNDGALREITCRSVSLID